MKREDYIQYRNTGNALLLWEYYNEKYQGPNKQDINGFMEAMFQYPLKQQAFQHVIQEWDVKYEIMICTDRNTGQVIKIC